MDDERIGKALRDAPVPDEAGAAERGLRVVHAAFDGEEVSRPRPPRLRRLGLALLAATVIFVLLLTPVGAEVRELVKDVVEDEQVDPATALTRLPGGGELLVESSEGPWIVRADGSQRLLGDFGQATWSPHGLFVAVTDGGRLSAVDPLGNPRWTVTRPASVRDPRWSPSGFRVAYRAGPQLRVLAGDGTGDSAVDPAVAPIAPAWRPGGRHHVLAYADRNGQIKVLDTDSRRRHFATTARLRDAVALEWSSDGDRLLAAETSRILIYEHGRPIDAIPARRAGGRIVAAAWEPGSHRLAYLQRFPSLTGTRTELVLVGTRTPRRQLIAVPGRLVDVVWAPDGSRVLTGWRAADQWFFVPVADRVPRTVSDIRSQFAPGSEDGVFPRVVGWVQPAR